MDPYGGGGGGAGGSGGGDAHGFQISLWDWQVGEHCEHIHSLHLHHNSQTNSRVHLCTFLSSVIVSSVFTAEATKFVWDCLNQDDDELMGLLGNQTPLRDCRDFFADIPDISCKETLDPEESREPKRRRTLEYPSESSQSEVGTHETSSPFVASQATETSLLCTDEPQSLHCDVQYGSNNLDTINSLSNEAPYWQQDNHLEHSSYGTPVYVEPDQTPCTQESVVYVDDQAGVSGSSEIVPVTETLIMQETRKLSTLKVSKGGSSSLVKAKQNITTTVAYPFTLIKPSWEEGDVTLQDINQRIRAPPKKPPEILGTSAFSGKPVIGKTRIRTDGGKGSITILRTKG